MQYELFTDEDLRADSPFKDRVVCVLGNFSMSSRALQKKLLELGADYKPSTRVSRNVHYVLLGEDAPQDQLQYIEALNFNGYVPKVLRQQDLDNILQGHYASYYVPEEITKNLHLTYGHYLRFRVDYTDGLNPLYTRELYLSPDTSTDSAKLSQMLGDRGIYANAYVDDNTDLLLISNSTHAVLQQGGTNDILRMIEQTYNSSRSQTYRFVMTTEDELLQWLHRTPAV